MPLRVPSDAPQARNRDTARLTPDDITLAAQVAGSPSTDSAMVRLDALLDAPLLVQPPAAFSHQVMVRVAARRRRAQTVRRVRQILSVSVLLAAMIAGTTALMLTAKATYPEVFEVMGRALEQLASVGQSLVVAGRVLWRIVPGEPAAIIALWAALALLVSIVWYRALGRAQLRSMRA